MDNKYLPRKHRKTKYINYNINNGLCVIDFVNFCRGHSFGNGLVVEITFLWWIHYWFLRSAYFVLSRFAELH
jgi:hypothetical protein